MRRTREIKFKCPDGDEWWNYPWALAALAHESYHLRGEHSEAAAECYAVQTVASVAKRLGASEQEAKTASDYYWTVYYPSREKSSPAYSSSECRDGGALDLNPASSLWP